MTQLEIWLLAIGLAMDCFTVSIASGILQKQWHGRTIMIMALAFGLFQAGMPLIGWMFTQYFSGLIESFDHWIAFGLLAYLGGRMILGSLKKEEECKQYNPTRLRVILTLAIATSIDALAIGISFACIGMLTFRSILNPVIIIGIASFLFSFIGYGIGVFCGKRFRLPVEPIGGAILIAIGCHILIEHIMV